MRTLLIMLLLFAMPMPMPTAAEEIPFSQIYATMPQEGMQAARGIKDESGQTVGAHGAVLQTMLRSIKISPADVFLVEGPEAANAVKASSRVFERLARVFRPVAEKKYNPWGEHWFVVYLGAGHSGPPSFQVESVSVAGKTIRLSYTVPKAKTFTADVVHYMYFVKLGRLAAGDYELELYDSDRKKVVLMRLVDVGPVIR